MQRCNLLTTLLAGLMISGVAHADPKDDARRHFAAGLAAAEARDYELALDRFLAAQEAFPHPATLYNIAKSYADLEDLPNALTYYQLFQAADPERAAIADPIVAELRRRLAAPTATAPTPTPTPAPQPPIATVGPTTEELDQLQGLASQLQALTEALQQRAAQAPVAVAEPQPEVPEPPEPPQGPETPQAPTAALPEVEGGFLDQAYERIVITASRVGQEPLDSPSTVTVLTADDIRLSGAVNVPDLLRRVVGVDVMSLSAGQPDVSIRGFNNKLNNKVLVLIDGRSTYLDFIGATLWETSPIQLEEIERIEVIRGPGSAVYGANAVTGVINIITRTPGDGGQVVRVDVGSPGLVRSSAVASGRSGNTTYRLSAGHQRHGRWAQEHAPGTDPPIQTFFEDDHLALRTLKLNGRIDHTLSEDVAISLAAGMSDTQEEFYNFGALPNFALELDHHYLRSDLFLPGLHLRAFWNASSGSTGPWSRPEAQRDSSLDGEFDNDVIDLELEAPLEFETGSVAHTLNLGGGYRFKGIRFSYLEGGFEQPWIENHFKGFLNEQIAVGRFGAVASLRADLHPLIPITQTISPRGALLFRIFDKTSVRASAGSAYRAPNGIESYMRFPLPTPTDGVYIEDFGNRDLRPERINSLELGVHDESTFLHTADLAIYVNQVTDLIALDDVTTAINPFNPQINGIEIGETGWINLASAYTGVGVEADLELYPTDGLDVFANANLMQVIENTGEARILDHSASNLKINGGFSYRTPLRTDLSLAGHYLSAQEWRLRQFDPQTLQIVQDPTPIRARLLLSARVGVRPLPDQDLEIAGTLWNITELLSGDGFLEHPEGQPVIGRAYVTLSYRF